MTNQKLMFDDIFVKELQEVNSRRKTTFGGGEGPSVNSDSQPSIEHGLVGLAISGGGIRSASFALGAIQELSREGVLKRVDYLSTISGGGYIGSCLSSLLNDPLHGPDGDEFPLRKPAGKREPPALCHLRDGSNYMAPHELGGSLQIPAVFIRGLLLNLLLILPYILFSVLVTGLLGISSFLADFLEQSEARDTLILIVIIALCGGLYVFLASTFPLFWRVRAWWLSRSARSHVSAGSWLCWRERYDRLLTLTFTIGLATPAVLYVLVVVGWVLSRNIRPATWLAGISPYGWVAFGLLSLAGLLMAWKSTFARRVLGATTAVIAGIGIPVAVYLGLTILFIQPPLSVPDKYGEFSKVLNEDKVPEGLFEAARAAALKRGLVRTKTAWPEPKVSTIQRPHSQLGVHTWTLRTGYSDEVLMIARQDDQLLLVRSDDLVSAVWQYLLLLAATGLLLFFNSRLLSVNTVSPHVYWRDRLSRLFLFSIKNSPDADNESVTIIDNDELQLSELNRPGSKAPYHLINVALNIPASRNPSLRGRNSDFFFFSKLFVGSESTGYSKTEEIEKRDIHLNLGTAMAISAGAAAPSMGAMGYTQLRFLMTMLNTRLSYWVPNPLRANEPQALFRGAGANYLWREAFGALNETGRYVNVSDGGHLENLGIYELLRRRCALIIAVDGEADPELKFGGLVTLMRYARIDLGVDINIDLDPLRKGSGDLSKAHWAIGTIDYGEQNGERMLGKLVYLKLSFTGDEREYLKAYRDTHPEFPHEPTADQFFTEAQFECYRELGAHVTEGVTVFSEFLDDPHTKKG